MAGNELRENLWKKFLWRTCRTHQSFNKFRELTETTSWLSTPEQAPLPYLIENDFPFFLYVDDLSLWYLLWSTKGNNCFKVYFLGLLNLLFNYKNILLLQGWWLNTWFQKQPSRGVLRKRCSENMQQIYKTPCRSVMATLLKLHFGMDVLLKICCIFSEHLFLRTPPDSCFCDLEIENISQSIVVVRIKTLW